MRYPAISFVIPMYNESANIEETVGKVVRLARELADDYEIVLADDASSDGTGDIADRLSREDVRIKSVRLENNTKFGGALAAGLKKASKEIIVYTDADLPVKEDDVKKGLALLEKADVVTGYSLVLKDDSLKRIVMSKGYNFLVRILFGFRIKDINSGFKIYRSGVIKDLRLMSKSPFVDVEIFAEARKRGFKIEQFGLIFDLRTKGVSTISRMSVVARTFWDMLAYKFSRIAG
ncbi:MAG: glycosyltransferase family 2 protein [Candidatus Omnitrophica bacterium]|nr:glycosyltransferase family 2 protein [Candidatus Omnitrophota bacterium]